MKKARDISAWTDARLVEQCCRGSELAWSELIRRYGPLIHSIARRYRLSPEDGVDVFGQVCKILLENLDKLSAREKLPGYIATTTQRSCLAILRNNQRQLRLADAILLQESTARETPLTSDELIRDSLREFMARRALEQIGGKCQKLLWHLFFDPDQPEYAQLSKLLGMPVASIGPTRLRCLEKFRRLLSEMGFDE